MVPQQVVGQGSLAAGEASVDGALLLKVPGVGAGEDAGEAAPDDAGQGSLPAEEDELFPLSGGLGRIHFRFQNELLFTII